MKTHESAHCWLLGPKRNVIFLLVLAQSLFALKLTDESELKIKYIEATRSSNSIFTLLGLPMNFVQVQCKGYVYLPVIYWLICWIEWDTMIGVFVLRNIKSYS